MAVPKDRTSRSKRDKRRSHHALAMPARSLCPKCREPKAPHRVCPYCWTYRNREVIPADEE